MVEPGGDIQAAPGAGLDELLAGSGDLLANLGAIPGFLPLIRQKKIVSSP